jgi:hypothetical protein
LDAEQSHRLLEPDLETYAAAKIEKGKIWSEG